MTRVRSELPTIVGLALPVLAGAIWALFAHAPPEPVPPAASTLRGITSSKCQYSAGGCGGDPCYGWAAWAREQTPPRDVTPTGAPCGAGSSTAARGR